MAAGDCGASIESRLAQGSNGGSGAHGTGQGAREDVPRTGE